MERLMLVIEASTPQASVAVLADDAIVADVSVTSIDPITGTRLEGVLPAIAACFETAHAAPSQLSGIVCSAGPGGFTSLRSAAAIAKGMCSVLGIPLYVLSSLELLVATARLAPGRYMPAIDAGRGECYTSLIEIDNGKMPVLPPIQMLPRTALEAYAQQQHAHLVGPGLDIDVSPRASAVHAVLSWITARDPVALETWEPTYGRLAEAQVKWESTHGRPLAL
jgi:tRNA threonylcarbamoyladenosine biosynthesis protein TsaB